MKRTLIPVAICVIAYTASALAEPEGDLQFLPDGCTFSPIGDNPYFPLRPGHRLVLRGEEDGAPIEVIWEVLHETRSFTLGVEVGAESITFETAIVRETEYEDGELVEISHNYFAECLETGTVFYFGEDVDDYEDGILVGHEGAWLAGEDGNTPGVIMPGVFHVGDAYFQEFAPGSAEDLGFNAVDGLTVSMPAATFSEVVKVQESDPLELDADISEKLYAPGIGLIFDDGLELAEYFIPPDRQFVADGCTFLPVGTNPYFPLVPGKRLVLKGEDDGEIVDLVIDILHETREFTLEIHGVSTTFETAILRETETIDGELYEISYNYYAECQETGSVFYFGEHVDFYEDGEIVGHDGAWLAGVNGALPGVIMPGAFNVGDEYYQETAPGIAEDRAVNAEAGLTVMTEAGEFTGVVKVLEYDPLEPDSEPSVKLFAPGVGMIADDDLLLLQSLVVPRLDVGRALLLSWDLTGEDYVLEAAPQAIGPFTEVDTELIESDGRLQAWIEADQTMRFFRLALHESL